MPTIVREWLASRPGLRVVSCRCDGADGGRPRVERTRGDAVWVVLRGRFALRHARFRHVADPTTAVFLRAGDAYEVSHPDGGDVCLALGGTLVGELVETGTGARPIGADAWSRVQIAAARLHAGEALAGLALEEALAAAFPADTSPPPAARDRDVAGVVAHAVRLRFDERLPLSELADEAGVSMFHACRVFRRVTGQSIHQFQLEVQLRHALGLLLDGGAPLADIAASTGFASQAHFTHRFRRRFGVTPGSVRAARTLRAIRA
ncbi:MAG TPA: AraC family transcriptional regulator [Haliangiales bacterium]|nr:AraC family transcriptional regulator [Haliangiales bacterium]